MNLKNMLTASAAACLLTLATAAAAEDEVVVKSVPVAEGIYMLTGQGGNLGLFIGGDGPS